MPGELVFVLHCYLPRKEAVNNTRPRERGQRCGYVLVQRAAACPADKLRVCRQIICLLENGSHPVVFC